ncbi:hypothetical protein TH63_16990 [Rufibacter radiotolerans]|uniref:Uncharacterized protein n=1 Tax=Rufibacter radiotolerans TaxID=1379910 RepID=A0A0H4VT21_9BACT|nr:hypothetical protein TH63_16990 [Rufibacter radiotolerans]
MFPLPGCDFLSDSPEEEKLVMGQWLTYQQTQCADPWEPCTSQDAKACAGEYIKQQGFTVLKISVTRENDGASCLACTCLSGQVVKVKVSETDVSKLLAVGFKKQ